MSTAHIYGDPPAARCDEDAPHGYGLAPIVGRAWEEAYASALDGDTATRRVIMRTSFVIGRANAGGSGALGRLGLLARLGLGGRVGSGKQGMSWLHETDLNRFISHAIETPTVQGIYNLTSPNPVIQVEFMRQLRRVSGGLGALGIALPATELMVRIGAPLVMRTDPELALYGRYILPARLSREGFTFQFPELAGALRDLTRR